MNSTKNYIFFTIILLLLTAPYKKIVADRAQLVIKAGLIINDVHQQIEGQFNVECDYFIEETNPLPLLTDKIQATFNKIIATYKDAPITFYDSEETEPIYNFPAVLELIQDRDFVDEAFSGKGFTVTDCITDSDQMLTYENKIPNEPYEKLNEPITGLIFHLKKTMLHGNSSTYKKQLQSLLTLQANTDYTQRLVSIFTLFAANYFEPFFVEWAVGAILRYADEIDESDFYGWRPLCDASLYYLYTFIQQQPSTISQEKTKNKVLRAILRAYTAYTGDTHDYTTDVVLFDATTKNYNECPKPMHASDPITIPGCKASLYFFSDQKEQTPAFDSNEGPLISQELITLLQLDLLQRKIARISHRYAEEHNKRRVATEQRKIKAPTLPPLPIKKNKNRATETFIDTPRPNSLSPLALDNPGNFVKNGLLSPINRTQSTTTISSAKTSSESLSSMDNTQSTPRRRLSPIETSPK